MEKAYFAAIDLGTNACRIMISNEQALPVYRKSITVKLGENLQSSNKFSVEAMDRTLNCLFSYKQQMDKYNVKDVRAIATAAARHAENGEEFIRKVYNETHISLDVISPLEEARLNLKGAISHIKGQSQYALVFDIGGGSTEISLARNDDTADLISSISIPWGSRNSSDAFFLSEFNIDGFEKLQFEVKKHCDLFLQESHLNQYLKDTKIISTSSTPLRLAAMINNFGKYDRYQADGVSMTREQLDGKIHEVYNMPLEERINSPYIGRNRGPIFISACIIFKTIYDALNLNVITASLKAAQEAIIEELIQQWQSQQTLQAKEI